MDSIVEASMEGGYKQVRPRTTRKPLKTFSTGWTELVQADADLIANFFDLVGRHAAFNYTHPITGIVHSVRFDSGLEMQYVGVGSHFVYNISITMTEE